MLVSLLLLSLLIFATATLALGPLTHYSPDLLDKRDPQPFGSPAHTSASPGMHKLRQRSWLEERGLGDSLDQVSLHEVELENREGEAGTLEVGQSGGEHQTREKGDGQDIVDWGAPEGPTDDQEEGVDGSDVTGTDEVGDESGLSQTAKPEVQSDGRGGWNVWNFLDKPTKDHNRKRELRLES